ncbi:hypothetical protein EDC96DRAFT_119145 [Choanephora cucurbitarum]|nr:hypothetical protein EDC96DRAFT_119145 [Choanephora cucurbitarum]
MRFFNSRICLFVCILWMFNVCQARETGDEHVKLGLGRVVDLIENIFKGTGTFFHPATEGGAIGSCGPKASDHSRICAMNIKQYGKASRKSPWCFVQLRVKYKGKETYCTVTDCCPGCNEGSLDMTPEVFNDLAHPNVGVIPIEWCVVGYRGCK